MDGTSSLDQPTGARKYSMAAPSAGERAAKADRMDQAASDRMLSRTMRDSSQPASVRIAAAKEQQSRRDTPGYVNGRGIKDAEQNRNQDSQTADKFTAEGLRLQGKENPADVVAGQADAANKGVGVSTADGGTDSKIGTSKADASGRVTMEKRNPASGALGNGSGSSAENARESLAEGSTGGEWVNAGPSATPPATKPPVAQGGAASGKPVISRDLQAKRDAVTALKDQWSFDEESKVDRKDYRATPDQISKEDSAASAETAFNNLIKDRPADQKAMFARLSNEDKAAMVQKNESLKTIREETAKLGPDKNSNAEQAKALIPGARREIDSAINDAGEFNYKGEDLEKAKTLRGLKAPDDVSVNSQTSMLFKRHGKMTSQLQDIESRESAFFA